MNGISLEEALENARHPGMRFPHKDDVRHRKNGDFPALSPSFAFAEGDTVFTIGSCFARNIEEKLSGFHVPTREFSVPKEEWPTRANGLLNEFNPGTISQRILAAVEGRGFGSLAAVQTVPDQWTDQLLCGGGAPVSYQRLLERRAEIDALYRKLPSANVVILTLGLVEAWYDEETNLYLNQWPKAKSMHRFPDRYRLRVLDVGECCGLLQPAFSALIASGVKKIIVTVSPVPLQATFTGRDCVMANAFSKAALRVCADRLMRRFPEVDYFPSYEIVVSGGSANFEPDNTHVRTAVVGEIVNYMLSAYTGRPQEEPDAPQVALATKPGLKLPKTLLQRWSSLFSGPKSPA